MDYKNSKKIDNNFNNKQKQKQLPGTRHWESPVMTKTDTAFCLEMEGEMTRIRGEEIEKW